MEEQSKAGQDETKQVETKQVQEQFRAQIEKIREKSKEAQEVTAQGKGILHLEKPILARDEEITELAYDFMELTGLEYVDAMDRDPNAGQVYRITYRQALALFAAAAAKQTENMDSRDIMERIGVTDAATGAQLAMVFFSGSVRAGRMRLSKK